MFHEKLWTHDYYQNILDWTRLLGRVDEIPVIVRHRSINPNAIRSNTEVAPQESDPEIDHLETKYLWEFDKYKNQLQQWYNDGTISQDCKMYYWIDENKYKVTSFEYFISLSGDDLILLGRIGKRFEGVLKPNDADSIEMLRTLVKEEIQKGLLSQTK